MNKSLDNRCDTTNRLKTNREYKYASFATIVSSLLSLLLLVNSYDVTNQAVRPYVFTAAVLYIFFSLLQLGVTIKIKHDISRSGDIRTSTRSVGYLLLLSLLTGNVFIAAASLQLLKSRASLHYSLAVYMLLTQLFVIGVSALNLFKPYVADTFPAAMLILLVIAIFQLTILILIACGIIQYRIQPWIRIVAILLLFTAINGNLFALLLGVILLLNNPYDETGAKWREVWERITRNAAAMSGLFFILFLFSISICSFFTFDYTIAVENDYSAILQTPSLTYPLGTDNFGRCLFSRIIFGARISLIVGIISTAIPVIVGGVLGAISGFYGRRTDNIIMRLLDVLYAIPGILLAIAIIAAFGANTINLIAALSIGSIPSYARTMRASVMVVATYEYVEAARALGQRKLAIIFQHIVPNSLAPMIVKSTLTIGGAVISTSSLSYLGLGVEPHIPEWGNILKLGSTYLESHSYLAIYPGIAIIALVLSFNFLGDGLRDALDPKMH
ncbi:peptide ABC transporter, permease protein [Paenibacillus alvei TS-15]|uniref:Peptide ABC transporter, permease protein n=1 Tax=Paenibacillus alvei TS-15 TaxID=1117108 RepID=S9TPQ0_PAEAL|nr:ABC transporter permease [Paenibacillus alvei]EPY04296.1 peptide ABC transporter, permease protein [Paenibacillus alvei TS-15]